MGLGMSILRNSFSVLHKLDELCSHNTDLIEESVVCTLLCCGYCSYAKFNIRDSVFLLMSR